MHYLEKEKLLFGEVFDHAGIYGSKAAEGFSEFRVGFIWITRQEARLSPCCAEISTVADELASVLSGWITQMRTVQ